MKKILLIALVMSSMAAFAGESNSSGTSYSDGNGMSSGSSGMSGTSETSMREQINANKGAVAAFIQSNEIQTSNAEVKEIVEIAKRQMHLEIERMSDRDVINNLIAE